MAKSVSGIVPIPSGARRRGACRGSLPHAGRVLAPGAGIAHPFPPVSFFNLRDCHPTPAVRIAARLASPERRRRLGERSNSTRLLPSVLSESIGTSISTTQDFPTGRGARGIRLNLVLLAGPAPLSPRRKPTSGSFAKPTPAFLGCVLDGLRRALSPAPIGPGWRVFAPRGLSCPQDAGRESRDHEADRSKLRFRRSRRQVCQA